MAMKLQGLALEQWRDYFNTAQSDIFDIIEHAMSVAALDYPTEFRLQRDQIAQKLYTFTSATRCSGCDSDNAGVSKESKASDISSGTGDDPLVNSNVSHVDFEALTDEVERKAGIVGEVLRIKDVLLNGQDESDSELFDSLRRLELMALTVDNLEATHIGKVVNRFRKHSSKQIRQLAQTLITGWRKMVDAWISATEAIADTPESVNPTVVVEEEAGLPCPPLDEEFLLTFEPTSMDFSQLLKFFDGMDDKSQQMKSLEPVAKPNNKPSNTNTGSGRPTRNNMEQKPNTESKLVQKSDKMAASKMPLSSQQYELKTLDELSVQQKHTKRKLQEQYQQAENAKKRRTIRVMELHDLPNLASGNKKSYLKSGNRNRQSVNGRRSYLPYRKLGGGTPITNGRSTIT